MRILERWGYLFLIIPMFSFSVLVAQQPASSSQNPSKAVQQIPGNSPSSMGTANVNSPDAGSGLLLGPGDLVDIGVYNVPELATKARIGSNGDIYLPLVDYIHIAGLTPEEAQNLIQKKLADGGFVRNPHVNVFVDEHAMKGASLLGEVARPGIYPMLGQQRLFDLISAAGGFTSSAGRSISITHRDQPDKPVVVPVSRNLSDDPESNILVFPGDTIIVRKADIVYVVGDVGRPSGFLMDNGRLTVLQAIALAGGTNKTAKLSGVKLIHRGSGGITETTIQLKKILQAKASDQPLQAEDILFVPSSAAKVAMAQTLGAALQAATAVSVVAAHP
ncbi:MAG: polysaccharide biosynthesis/export family protein [Terriglobales bacterium]|jgi:polysaccharide export outer membrane protein|nr:polysaccharide biosynthesis/export family protein [Terriglobales bacterium]